MGNMKQKLLKMLRGYTTINRNMLKVLLFCRDRIFVDCLTCDVHFKNGLNYEFVNKWHIFLFGYIV